MGLNYNTPLVEHKIRDRSVWVKRDDLHNGDLDLPPWAKIEGVRQLLTSDLFDKDIPIIHLTVRGSYTGWVLGYYGKKYGYDIKIAYGDSDNYPMESLDKIKSYGVDIVPLEPNMMRVLYNSMKKMARENGWRHLPYAFDHSIYHTFWENKLSRFMEEHEEFDTLVCLGGSGVTSVGMIRGFIDKNNFPMSKDIHVVVSSTVGSVTNKLKRRECYFPSNIFVHDTPYDFYDEMNFYETPFPCNVYWDKKAWWWLEQNIDKLKGKILFWNIGA